MFSGDRINTSAAPQFGYTTDAETTQPLPVLPDRVAQPTAEVASTLLLLSREEVLMSMAANTRIPIANGYALVPDYRPAGEEDEYIPQEVFTWYFMNDMAPYASTGEHWKHDRHHGPSYYQLFQSPSFADCIRQSATVSFNLGNTFYFTRVMDKLGDSHVLLTGPHDKPDTESDYGHLLNARRNLQSMIRLRLGEDPNADQQMTWQEMHLFAKIWHETDLAVHEERVDRELMALPAQERDKIIGFYDED